MLIFYLGRKGQAFQPDQRMKALLEEGVALGNATARALCFAPRSEDVRTYGAFGDFRNFTGSRLPQKFHQEANIKAAGYITKYTTQFYRYNKPL